MNRAWQTLMGRGLVASPGDFGRQSAAPTHPELLDWLATEFVRSGWDLKQLHRLRLLRHRRAELARRARLCVASPADRPSSRLFGMPGGGLTRDATADGVTVNVTMFVTSSRGAASPPRGLIHGTKTQRQEGPSGDHGRGQVGRPRRHGGLAASLMWEAH